MNEQTDVVVVGARCAGSPLAALLAREGVRVTVLERTSFPSDTLSSHLFEADALAFLDRLGVIEPLRATGAPMVMRTDTRVEDVDLAIELPRLPGDPGGIASVRRTLLDPILADAASRAGAELHTGAQAVGLVEHGGRLTGVRIRKDGSETEVRGRLVVGADGRQSTVARLARARRYNVTPNQRLLFWRFFEHAQAEPTFLSHRWGEHFILGLPSDSGLYQVLIWPELGERAAFQADRDRAFMEHARLCEPIAELIAGAEPAGSAIGAFSFEGFFRQASGPGWVLCGDAGHFKSPAPGRGIGDAFLQAETLASAITGALGGSDAELDRAMERWGRWRDREFAEHYWLAYDLEQAGAVPAVLVEILRGLQRQGRAGLFFDVLNHRVRPSGVLTPPRVLGASARLLTRRGTRRRAFIAELGSLGAREARRRWRNAKPVYAPDADSAQASTTARQADHEAGVAGA